MVASCSFFFFFLVRKAIATILAGPGALTVDTNFLRTFSSSSYLHINLLHIFFFFSQRVAFGFVFVVN